MSEPDPLTPATATKRSRPVISCLECRRKKLKCDRTQPCQQCVKIGRPSRCEYQTGQEPEPSADYQPGPLIKRPRLAPSPRDNAGEGPPEPTEGRELPLPPPTATAMRPGVIEDLQERVTRLEKALYAQSQSDPPPPRNGDLLAYHTPPEISLSGNSFISPDFSAKPDQIGSQFDEACLFINRLQNDTDNDDVVNLRTQLKDILYSVDRNRLDNPTWPVPASTAPLFQHPLELPPFEVCKKLAVLYFGNLEHCFRILHWPEFAHQLDILFKDDRGERACRFGFLPQLVGVLGVAVLLGTHQECEAVNRASIVSPPQAMKYMEEFLGGLRDHERYLLPALQVKMLLLIFRWIDDTPMIALFHLNGELLRDALLMKMNFDPATLPGVSVYEGELRRRNWMTIVESDLLLSILCKMPCMVPPYTSRPPQNVNDEEIFDGMEDLPQSRPTREWTDGLCQYILSHSFPRRLAACRLMDGAGHIKVDDILQHTRYLESLLQDLPPPLRFNYLGDEASKTPPRLMARMELDISIRRPLMHLYSCSALAAEAVDLRQELRAGFLQSCLMIMNYQDLFDPRFSELNVARPQGYWDFFYNCYRRELHQALLGLCLEIKKISATPQTRDVVPNIASPSGGSVVKGPSFAKSSLLHAVKDSLEPMIRRLARRGTSLKDIVYYNIILASLLPEQPDQAKDVVILERLQELVRECRDQLERDNVPILPADRMNTSGTGPEPVNGMDFAVGAKFDPYWESFPDLEIFSPFGGR